MEHDWSVFKKFTDGGYGKADNVMRLVTAAHNAIDRAMKNKKYDPSDPTLDHEAIAVLRLTFSRVLASAIASLVSVMPIVGWMLRKFGHQTFSMMRSFENPAVGVAFRTAAWAAIISMGADDDDSDDALSELINDFSFLFLPVFIGMLGRDAYSVNDWIREE